MLVLQDGNRAGTGSLPLRLAASLQEVTATLVWKNEWSRSSACPPLQRSRQHKEQRCQLGSVSLGYGRAPLLCLSVTYCFPEDQPITEAAASWAASSSKASQQPLAQMIPKRRTIAFDACEVFCGVGFPVEGWELPHQLPQKQAPWSRLPCRPRGVQQRCTPVLQGRGSPVGWH